MNPEAHTPVAGGTAAGPQLQLANGGPRDYFSAAAGTSELQQSVYRSEAFMLNCFKVTTPIKPSAVATGNQSNLR